jgi:hypothetical protein
VENSCELGNEPSGSIKCWELPNGCTTCGLSNGTQLHRVSYLFISSCHLLTVRSTYVLASFHFTVRSNTGVNKMTFTHTVIRRLLHNCRLYMTHLNKHFHYIILLGSLLTPEYEPPRGHRLPHAIGLTSSLSICGFKRTLL